MLVFNSLLLIMLAMWKKLSCRSPGSGKSARLIGLVTKAASCRKRTVSLRRLVWSKWMPQCSEFGALWASSSLGGVTK